MYGCGYSCGYGGCNKCCKKVCCPPKKCYSGECPPQVAGSWSLQLKNIVRQATGPDVTCANVTDVTASGTTPIVVSMTQCANPNDIFVLSSVTSGPTGASPIVPGDQLIGVFCRDPNKCWRLKAVSPTDNSTFDFTFKDGYCPKCTNFCYSKPVDSPTGFGAVGGGFGSKL